MGLINIDEETAKAFDEAEVGGSTEPKLPAGPHEGTITSVSIVAGDKVWKPWMDVALQWTVKNEDGYVSDQIEVAPLTNKQGETTGKLRWLKGQLQGMGYTGGLKDLEMNIGQVLQNKVKIEIEEEVSDKTNPHTGKPYVNRNSKIVALLEEVDAEDNLADQLSAEFDAVEDDGIPF